MKKVFASFAATFLLVFPVLAFVQIPVRVLAASAPVNVTLGIQNPIKYATFSAFVAGVTKTAVNILMPFVVLSFIYSGFLFVKAQGNETEITKAKTAIYWSVIGAFILFGAWGFAQIISTTVSSITGN